MCKVLEMTNDKYTKFVNNKTRWKRKSRVVGVNKPPSPFAPVLSNTHKEVTQLIL